MKHNQSVGEPWSKSIRSFSGCEALEESANLPAPEIIAADITADLQAALAQFAEIANDLKR